MIILMHCAAADSETCMNYFDGIEWAGFHHYPVFDGFSDKTYDRYVLNYVHSGQMHVSYGNDTPLTVRGPAVYFCYPGPRIRAEADPKAPSNYIYVSVRGPRIRRCVEAGLLPASPPPRSIPVVQADVFYDSFVTLLTRLRMPDRGSDRSVLLFENLCLQLHEQEAHEARSNPLGRAVQAVGDDIRAHPEQTWDFGEVAARLHVSVAHFRRVFKTIHGMPVARFLRNARLDTAAEMLRMTWTPVKTIATEVGMPDLCQFTKAFKRTYSLPPAAYRREVQGHRNVRRPFRPFEKEKR